MGGDFYSNFEEIILPAAERIDITVFIMLLAECELVKQALKCMLMLFFFLTNSVRGRENSGYR